LQARMPLMNALNKLFHGTPLHREKLEAYSLLRDLASEVAAGRVSDEEAEKMINGVAQTIAALLSAQGKVMTVEEVYKRIREAFDAEVNTQRLAALRSELARRIAERIKSGGF